jgi:hypothetical protein
MILFETFTRAQLNDAGDRAVPLIFLNRESCARLFPNRTCCFIAN